MFLNSTKIILEKSEQKPKKNPSADYIPKVVFIWVPKNPFPNFSHHSCVCKLGTTPHSWKTFLRIEQQVSERERERERESERKIWLRIVF